MLNLSSELELLNKSALSISDCLGWFFTLKCLNLNAVFAHSAPRPSAMSRSAPEPGKLRQFSQRLAPAKRIADIADTTPREDLGTQKNIKQLLWKNIKQLFLGPPPKKKHKQFIDVEA